MRSAPLATAARLLLSFSLLAWSGCAPVEDDAGLDGTPGSLEQAVDAVSFRAASNASGVNLTSLSVGKPAGVVAGDVMIARIAGRNHVDAVITPPAGWTLLRSDQSSSQLKSWVLWKVAGASEPASYAFGLSIASNAAGTIVAFSGVDPVNPIDASAGQKNGTSATFTTPAVTTTVAGGTAVWFGSQIWAGSACPASGITQPTGFTEPTDTCLVSTSTGLLVDAAYKTLGAAGAQPAWNGSSAFANTNTAQVVTLRPAAAPPVSAVSFRAASNASGVNLTSLSVGKPAGVVAGDVLLARIAGRNHVDAVITPPAGWTLLRSDQSSSQLKSWVLWKVAGASEPASYAFGLSIASNAAGTIVAFSGADPTSPIDASAGQKNGTSSSLAAPAVTTTVANGTAVWFGSQIWGGAACPADGITQPTGFTEPTDTCLVSSSTGLLFDAAYKTLGAAGAQPAWNGSSAFANTNTAQVVTLRPAGAPSCTAAGGYASSYTTVGSFNADAGAYAIVEVSGVAASRTNPGVLYAHSENNANFVAINKATAAVVGSYTAGWSPFDWEDIATGPCPAGKCIFMADIGRESGNPPPKPSSFNVYRMKEPDLAAGETSGTVSGDRFPFVYPDAPANAEALMVHPTTGDIYVVTKDGATGVSKVYKFPQPLPAPGTTSTLIYVASLTLPTQPTNETPKDATNYRSVTAGAIHPCANRFLLRTYYAVHEYIAPAGGSFESAFGATPIRRTDTAEGQGEAIEYEPDGSGYFTVSERTASPYTLKRVAAQ